MLYSTGWILISSTIILFSLLRVLSIFLFFPVSSSRSSNSPLSFWISVQYSLLHSCIVNFMNMSESSNDFIHVCKSFLFRSCGILWTHRLPLIFPEPAATSSRVSAICSFSYKYRKYRKGTLTSSSCRVAVRPRFFRTWTSSSCNNCTFVLSMLHNRVWKARCCSLNSKNRMCFFVDAHCSTASKNAVCLNCKMLPELTADSCSN